MLFVRKMLITPSLLLLLMGNSGCQFMGGLPESFNVWSDGVEVFVESCKVDILTSIRVSRDDATVWQVRAMSPSGVRVEGLESVSELIRRGDLEAVGSIDVPRLGDELSYRLESDNFGVRGLVDSGFFRRSSC